MGGDSSQNIEDLELPPKVAKEEEDRILPPLPFLPDKSNIMGVANRSSLENSFSMSKRKENINRFKNYGNVPVLIVHHICIYLDLRDLFSVFLSCKLFHYVANTEWFWKEYYENLTRNVKHNRNLKEEDIITYSSESKNWKLCVFHYSFTCLDMFYRKKYRIDGYYYGKKERSFVYSDNNEEIVPMKVCLVGEPRCGMSNFLLRLLKNEFRAEEIPNGIGGAVFFPIEVVYETELKGKFSCVRLEVWDTYGYYYQNRCFKSCPPQYYRGHSSCAVFFDIQRIDTFRKAKCWVKEIQRGCSRHYVVLVGAKIDMDENREVEKDEAEEFSKEVGIPYCEISSKMNINIYHLFGLLVDGAIQMTRKRGEEELNRNEL